MSETTVKLRAHHLLCLLTYIGKGYTQAFVKNFDALVDRINRGAAIEIVSGCDDICAALHDANGPVCDSGQHCLESKAVKRDQIARTAIAAALNLPLQTGSVLHWDATQYQILRSLFANGILRQACLSCPWQELCASVASEDFSGVRMSINKPLD
ncbi:MAG: DUF1284 domain-containing protein [Alphaproteobacteria bacterium]|nr:DUF1284 domain-containing protein [Alphaproteobacteria bacterium]